MKQEFVEHLERSKAVQLMIENQLVGTRDTERRFISLLYEDFEVLRTFPREVPAPIIGWLELINSKAATIIDSVDESFSFFPKTGSCLLEVAIRQHMPIYSSDGMTESIGRILTVFTRLTSIAISHIVPQDLMKQLH